MALLTTQAPSLTGVAVTFAAATAGGDTLRPSSTTALRVKNAHTAAQRVRIASVRQCDQGFAHDVEVSVPAGAEREIFPVGSTRFAGSGGVAAVTYPDGVTALTVAVVAQ